MGIFTQPDPSGAARRNPQGLNRYSYVLNNPLRFTDPTGLQEDDWQEPDGTSPEGGLPDAELDGPPEDAVDAAVMDVISDQPNWFDLGWQWEFRASHGGAGPTAGDYLDRHATMAEASGMGGEVAAGEPAPVGTWSVGVGEALFAGVGVKGSVELGIDVHGNVGLLISLGGGGYSTVGGGWGGLVSWTDAPSLNDLAGWSMQAGGSAGQGVVVGGEFVEGRGYTGWTFGAGPGLREPLLPWEVHGTVEHTWIPIQFNPKAFFDKR